MAGCSSWRHQWLIRLTRGLNPRFPVKVQCLNLWATTWLLPNAPASQKKGDTIIMPLTSANVERFSTIRLGGDRVMNWSLNIPPHLKRVATVCCVICFVLLCQVIVCTITAWYQSLHATQPGMSICIFELVLLTDVVNELIQCLYFTFYFTFYLSRLIV